MMAGEQMPHQEIDISWQVLRRIVQDWVGTSAELDEVKPLVGGCVNTTLALSTRGGERAVLKITPHRVNLQHEQEAYQLNLLRTIGLPVPEVYIWKIGTLDDPNSYLLMEYIEGVNLHTARQSCSAQEYDHLQEHLAEIVLTLHGQTATKYMRLGGGHSTQFDRWTDFYHAVYDTIWEETARGGLLPVKCRKQISKIHEKLGRLIAQDDVPRLVHWDIWSTNLLARPDADGRWQIAAVLDPNCKYAHFEAEIAYMELFQTITPAFLKAYQKQRKLPPEYPQRRRPIYQLYPLINHVHVFGQEYVKPLTAAVERAAALV
jgi:fructosamine-3-kinase